MRTSKNSNRLRESHNKIILHRLTLHGVYVGTYINIKCTTIFVIGCSQHNIIIRKTGSPSRPGDKMKAILAGGNFYCTCAYIIILLYIRYTIILV